MMKEKYNVRPLKKEDVGFIVNLVRTSFHSSYLIPSIYRGKGIGKFISEEIENPFSAYRYFALCEADVIAGYAEFKIFESTSTAFLNIISISNDYKNKGAGGLFLEYTKFFFLERGFASIILDVYESNVIAIKWYEKFGFKKITYNSFYQIELHNQTQNKEFRGYIQNYPQFKALRDLYGFYFLDLVVGDENIRLGTIDKDFIVRGSYSQAFMHQLPILLESLEFEKVYFIGSENYHKELQFIDRIIRMELNI